MRRTISTEPIRRPRSGDMDWGADVVGIANACSRSEMAETGRGLCVAELRRLRRRPSDLSGEDETGVFARRMYKAGIKTSEAAAGPTQNTFDVLPPRMVARQPQAGR